MSKQRRLRVLALISDLHSGSNVAAMPRGFKTVQGQTIEPSPLQAWFADCLEHGTKWAIDLAGDDPFGLIVNGDCIEGDHHHTDEIFSKRIGDHIECAAQLLTPLCSAASRRWFVRGTDCHVRDHEVVIAGKMKAEENPETGRPVFDRLTLEICGVRLVAKHHISTTSRPWLESNALGAELASEQLNAVRNGEPMPRIVAAGHRHVAGHVATAEGLCVVTSAWQGLTTHGHKVVSASRSKPSIYVLDWRGVPDGELPRVHRRVYEQPQPKPVSA